MKDGYFHFVFTGDSGSIRKEKSPIGGETSRQNDTENVGSFFEAMESCFNNYKLNDHFSAYQPTLKIMSQMTPLERNQVMGKFQYVLRTHTFNDQSLFSAVCERLFSHNWQTYY